MMFASVGASPTPLACPARGAPTRPAPRVGSSRKFGTRSRVPSVSSSARAAPEPTPEDDAEDDAASAPAPAPAPAPASLRASRRALLAATPAAFGLAARPSPTSASIPTSTSATPLVDVASAGAPSSLPRPVPPTLAGYANLHDPRVFNGLATPDRAGRSLDGLVPAAGATPDVEVARASAALDACDTPMQKYRQLVTLQNTDETTFYALLKDRTSELLPILYTPNVGDACLQFGTLSPRPPGLYVSLEDRGRVANLVSHWPSNDVRVAVLTDGERILGLGDQGVNGMGISAGKSMVYAACGVKPAWLLPIQVDTGTNNETLLADPLYVGLRRPRERGDAYDALLDELVEAIQARYGARTVIHWEDFAPRNAFRNLERFRAEGARTYNDDIQGTAAVTVAGLLAAVRAVKGNLRDQRVLFFGAGQANLGAADLLVRALVEEGASLGDARDAVWLFDSRGLVVPDRPEGNISEDKARFAHSGVSPTTSLEAAVRAVEPTALVGAAATPGAFTERVVAAMCDASPNPIVFALSNPTSKAECTAEQAYAWSKGKVVFASGTKFPDLVVGGRARAPGFANNAFIFPGVALGALASGASSVTDGMFLAAARCLAAQVTEEQITLGAVYPPTSTIREAAVVVGAAVAAAAEAEGVAADGACRGGPVDATTGKRVPSLDAKSEQTCVDWEACVRDYMKTCL